MIVAKVLTVAIAKTRRARRNHARMVGSVNLKRTRFVALNVIVVMLLGLMVTYVKMVGRS